MSQVKLKFCAVMLLLLGSAFIGYAMYTQFPNLLSNHPFLISLKKKLDRHRYHYSYEKVHIHLNNTFFQPGESVWFAAYVRDAESLEPSPQSEVVYVELINPKGSVLQSHRMIVRKGKAAGDFQLDSSWAGGIYKIKAYTKWQKNTNRFFEREITLQKAVFPNLNMQLHFEKTAYGPKDEVVAILDLNTLSKQALKAHAYHFVVSVGGEEIQRAKGKTNERGRAYVSFELPEKLNSNDGLLNIMLTYKGQTESISRSIPITLGDIDIQFFPEGGDFVADLNTNVAFKASNEFGKPADVSGEIRDSKGNKVADFSSYHQGMGSFSIKAKEGETYVAKITKPSNARNLFQLPIAKKNNYTINVEKQTDKSVEVHIISPVAEELYILAQQGGKMYFSQALQATKGHTVVRIPTQTFPIGVCQITLFDHEQVARAERLIFNNKHKQLKVNIQTNKEKYLPREKVDMTIKVRDENNQPVEGDFSLAVVDDKLLTFADDKQGQILASLLLETELNSQIEEPNFYFDDENDPHRLKPEINRKKALDYLLMTEGWRRFTWQSIQAEVRHHPRHKNERAIIAGYVQDINGKRIPNATVEVQNAETEVKTDKNGYFVLDNIDLYSTAVLNVTAQDKLPQFLSVHTYNQGLKITVYGNRTVAGTISKQNGKPAAGVTVAIPGAETTSTKTNAMGAYTIEIPENLKQIVVSGSKFYSQRFDVGTKENKEANFTLIEGDRLRLVSKKKSIDVLELDFTRAGAAPIEDNSAQKLILANNRNEVPLPRKAGRKKVVLAEEVIVANQDKVVLLEEKSVVPQANFYRARQFPEKKYKQGQTTGVRNDFRSTIYWNPSLKTDKTGTARLSFYNSDAITQFRISIEGLSNEGKIAQYSQKYFTQLPFEIVAKVPAAVISGDIIHLPLTLTNNTDRSLTGELQLKIPSHLQAVNQPIPTTVSIPAGRSKSLFLKYKVLNRMAEGNLEIAFEAEGMRDVLQTQVACRSRGFPVHHVFSGRTTESHYKLHVVDKVEGSIQANIKLYPSVLDEVMSSMKSMMRMPYGCFEQTSSSNYPNLLALNYMRETATSNKEIEIQAKKFLDVGYKRLTGYESPSGGFHWWGNDPGHEALTAYGLMQFVDMKSVYAVDTKMINRTAKWLLSRRDGKGSWNKSQYALHTWASSDITDAYIVYALCEAGYGKQLSKELSKSFNDAVKSEDPYMMGLMANAMLAMGKKTNGEALLTKLVKLQAKDGSFEGLTSSVVHSTGHSLKIETTSLVILAMMKTQKYTAAVRHAIGFIQKGKGHYGYGSTQGTVLALKALLSYAKYGRQADSDGTLAIWVDDQQVTTLNYEKGQREVQWQGLGQYLHDGEQNISVKYINTKNPLPFDIEVNYYTRQPDNAPECRLKLETALAKTSVAMGETVRLKAKVINTSKEGQAMTIAMVGIPAGLSVQHWQLKELKEKKAFSSYEIFEGYVVLHYEQMQPEEIRTISLDLKADIPGTYEAPASSTFLYYTNEFRNWDAPTKVTINS